MELDNLITNLKNKAKTQKTTTYLAIEIGLETVKAATWNIVAGKPQVIDTGSIEEADPKDTDKLLKAIDKTVTKAQQSES